MDNNMLSARGDRQWFVRANRGDYVSVARQYGVSEILAKLILNRKVKDIDGYLDSSKIPVADIHAMKGADTFFDVVGKKIAEGRKIRIIGDYDVDGVCSTYILTDGLTLLGGQADYDIPDRTTDGYGINERIIEQAHNDGVDTIITCDNGITAVGPIKLAKSYGMTVLVTDHHEVIGDIPDADTVVDPHQSDCPYPYKEMCGAGIAYRLICELAKKNGKDFSKKYLPFAALATICDIVELTGENRKLVKEGLAMMQDCGNVGLEALFMKNNISFPLTTYACGFVIGPCLNAAGRLDSALDVVDLFMETDIVRAMNKAGRLVELNERRKELTDEGFAALEKDTKERLKAGDRVLVLYSPDCSESVAGIIAGKICDQYAHPVIVLTDSENGIKGSARSIEGFDISEALKKHSDLMSRFGGHPQAAGLGIAGNTKKEQLANVIKLRDALNADTTELPMVSAKIVFDAELPFSSATREFTEELDRLAPFGQGNEAPLFGKRRAEVINIKILGKKRNAIKMTAKEDNRLYIMMMFGNADKIIDDLTMTYGPKALTMVDTDVMAKEGIELDVVYYPQINTYKGQSNMQMIVKEYRKK